MRFFVASSACQPPRERRPAIALFVGLVSSFSVVTWAVANPLIQQAVDAGALDAETALLYRVYEAADPDYLPAEYRHTDGSGALVCGTPVLVEARHAEKLLSRSSAAVSPRSWRDRSSRLRW